MAQIMVIQAGGALKIFGQYRAGLFPIRSFYLEEQLCAAASLSAIPCFFTNNQRRDGFFR